MAKFATHMGDPHADPQTSPQHADPHGLGACTWVKWGRFVIFHVLCLLEYGDTALKSLFLLALGAHKKACDNDTSRAVFPSIWAS